MIKIIYLVYLLLMIIPFKVFAIDEIRLNSGKVVKGVIVEKTDDYVKIDSKGVSLKYYRDEIESITTDTKNEDGSVSSSFQGSFSPETEKGLNTVMNTIATNVVKSVESMQTSCREFPDRLAKCEPYSCEFTHPMTGEPMKQEIIGMKNNVCVYVQEMPNGGKMSCNLSADSLAEIAQYCKAEAEKTAKGSYSVNSSSSDSDPWQKHMTNGDCVISGYDDNPPQ